MVPIQSKDAKPLHREVIKAGKLPRPLLELREKDEKGWSHAQRMGEHLITPPDARISMSRHLPACPELNVLRSNAAASLPDGDVGSHEST